MAQKNSNRSFLVLAALMVTGLATGLVFVWKRTRTKGPDETNNLARFECLPNKGAPVVYRISAETHLKFNAANMLGDSGGNQIVDSGAGLVGDLTMQVLKPEANGVRVAFRLDNMSGSVGAMEGSEEIRAQLSTPFQAVLDAGCQLKSFGFAKNVRTDVSNRLRGLMQSLSVAVAASAGNTKWSTAEWDNTGEYAARYNRGGTPLSFEKEKLTYTHPHTSSFGVKDKIMVLIKESKAAVTLDPETGWFSTFDSKEHVQVLRQQGGLVADLSSHIRLKRNLDVEPVVMADVADEVLWQTTETPAPEAPIEDPTPPKGMETMSLEDAMAQFSAMVHGDAATRGRQFLTLYLRARPEMALTMLEMVRTGKFPENLQAEFFHALEKAGTPQAHQALVTALGEDFTLSSRARAAAALPDVAQPQTSTLESLRKTATSGRSADPKEQGLLRNAATFAIGRLERNARFSNPALAQAAQTEIRNALVRANNVEGTSAVLDSIGNSGNPEFMDDLQPFLKDSSRTVRAHAISAMQHMPPDANKHMFSELMAGEDDPQVRGNVAVTYADQARRNNSLPPNEVLTSAISQLTTEPDVRVRSLLIDLIGPAAASDPASLSALVNQFGQESEPFILKLIGKYVPAEKLGT